MDYHHSSWESLTVQTTHVSSVGGVLPTICVFKEDLVYDFGQIPRQNAKPNICSTSFN